MMLICMIGATAMMTGACQFPAESSDRAVIRAGEPLPASVENRLAKAGWAERTSGKLGLWVSVSRQQLIGIEGERVRFVHPCSTAAKGVGNEANSYKTPTGWHEIRERFGDGLPLGAIFKERKYVDRVWSPDSPTKEDLILTRISWLAGLEEGVNKGTGIDSHARYIYIHGTPEEDKLGTPASHGCVRLSNKDVITVFDQTQSGTRVLITDW